MGEFHSDGRSTGHRVVDDNERGGAGGAVVRGERPHHSGHALHLGRNRRVFDKVSMMRSWLSSQIWDEWRVWQLARQRKKINRGSVGIRE